MPTLTYSALSFVAIFVVFWRNCVVCNNLFYTQIVIFCPNFLLLNVQITLWLVRELTDRQHPPIVGKTCRRYKRICAISQVGRVNFLLLNVQIMLWLVSWELTNRQQPSASFSRLEHPQLPPDPPRYVVIKMRYCRTSFCFCRRGGCLRWELTSRQHPPAPSHTARGTSVTLALPEFKLQHHFSRIQRVQTLPSLKNFKERGADLSKISNIRSSALLWYFRLLSIWPAC